MTMLLLGLVIFLGVHSVRIGAEGWRTTSRARVGEATWKGVYSLASLLGLVLICWGYSLARQQPTQLWLPPLWARHAAALSTLIAFILVTASYVPGNAIKTKLHHPMVLGVKVWALAHLLANGSLHAVLLFGAFLLWAVLDFRASRQRDRRLHTTYPAGRTLPTVITVAAGVAAWALFAFWAHLWLIGVRPFG